MEYHGSNFAHWAAAIVTVATLMTSHGDAAPVMTSAEPWNSPCAGGAGDASGSSSLADLFFTTSLSDEMHEASIANSKSKRLALQLKEKYLLSGPQITLAEAQILDSMTLTGFPQSYQVTVWKGKNDTVPVVKNDYHLLSVVAVFLQETQDEMPVGSSLVADLNSYATSVLKFLCHLSSIMETFSVTPDSHVTRDAMPAELREITTEYLRRNRDYITVKDGARLLAAMATNYVAMDAFYKSNA